MKKVLSARPRENTLESFCLESSPLQTKIALLTFYKINYPSWVEKFILIFEYLQLVSQAILSTSFPSETSKHHIYFFEIVAYALKLVNPSHLLTYNDSMSSTILIVILCCTLLKLGLFAKVIYASANNKDINPWLQDLWRWIYKLQTRGLYFLFTSFWIRTMIEAKQSDFKILGMSKTPLWVIGGLLILLELLFSLTLETQLCYFLPNKNFLSSKNNQLQMITFLQKFIIQIFTLSIKSNSEALNWIVSILAIVFDIQRIYELFFKLPLYHTRALILQGSLLAMTISLNLSSIVNNILKAADNQSAGLNFVIITWILLALLSIKISHACLKFQVLSLLLTNGEKNVELLLHKVEIAKELQRDERVPTSKTSNYAFNHLALTSHDLNIQEIFGLELPSNETTTMKKIYFLFFQKLSKKYPKNSLVKLHLAYSSLRNNEPYSKIIKMVNEIQKIKRSPNHLGASLLLCEIEKSILNNQSQQLDFSKFIKSKLLVYDLKNSMLEQTTLQIKICDNMLSETCNIEEIHSSAQKISNLKSFIQRKMDKLSKNLPENYISPYLFYAEYHIVVNQSADHFIKYYEMYTQKRYKAQRSFQEPNLIEENLYEDSNAFILISPQISEFGKILYSSKSLDNLCNGKNSQGLRFNFLSLFPPFLKEYYENIFKQSHLPNVIDQVHHAYLYNKEEYLVEVNFCTKYHPYLAHGLCLNMIIRPVPVSKNTEFLLLNKEGYIEGASKGLSKILKLTQDSLIPIQDFSDDLYLMNNAFNIVLKKNQEIDNKNRTFSFKRDMTYETAQEIYSVFTTEGQEIQLKLGNKKSKSSDPEEEDYNDCYKFHSQVKIVNFGNIRYKAVTLNKINYKNLQTNRRIHDHSPERMLTSPDNPQLTTERRHFFPGETLASEVSQDEVPRRFRRGRNNAHLQTLISETDLLEDDNQHRMETSIYHKEGIQTYANSYVSSQSSVRIKSSEKAENKIYKLAILSKSYPKSFTSLCFIFYAVILMTFAGQIIMKSVSDSTMSDLQIRKNLLKDSEEKTYKGSLIQLNGRGIVLELSKLLVQEGNTYVNISSSVPNLQVRLRDMKQASDNMLKNIYSLDKGTQEELFREDVMVTGSSFDLNDTSSKYLNIFQFTDEVANVIKTLAGLADPSTIAGYRIAYFLLINLCNGFLYKSAQITEILTRTVEKQKESFQSITNLFLILNPFLLTGIGLLLISIIWNQYRIEKKNMRAFVKIPSEGVKVIADRFLQFKTNLQNEENFEKRWLSVVNQDLRGFQQNQHTTAYSRKAETQKIQYKAFRKRYMNPLKTEYIRDDSLEIKGNYFLSQGVKYFIRVIACISVLVTITIWDLISTRHDIKVIYNRQGQLQFANYISKTTIATHMTYVELFFANNTLMVENQDAFKGLLSKSQIIKQIQSEIPQKFLEADGNYNPEVRDIIYKNDPECKSFVPAFAHYCSVLVAKGQPINMLVAMASLQTLIEVKIAHFLKVDRSNMTNLQAAAYWAETPLTYSVVLAEEAHNIADIMDESITQKISEMQNHKIVIITIFSIGLFFVSILTWLYVLQVIREVHNDFKKVLQTFPPNLVLSSYLLKRFLQTTSSGLFFKDMK